MSEVLDVFNALGTPLKLSWLAWLAWGVVQYAWYLRQRSGASARKPVVRTKAAAKPASKPAAPSKPVTYPVHSPVVGRLITPTHVASEVKAAAPVETPIVAAPPPAPEPVNFTPPVFEPTPSSEPPLAAFDPAQAVIESFSGVVDSPLDKFVRDFEMEARPRRRRVPPESPSYGAEAPQHP